MRFLYFWKIYCISSILRRRWQYLHETRVITLLWRGTFAMIIRFRTFSAVITINCLQSYRKLLLPFLSIINSRHFPKHIYRECNDNYNDITLFSHYSWIALRTIDPFDGGNRDRNPTFTRDTERALFRWNYVSVSCCEGGISISLQCIDIQQEQLVLGSRNWRLILARGIRRDYGER